MGIMSTDLFCMHSAAPTGRPKRPTARVARASIIVLKEMLSSLESPAAVGDGPKADDRWLTTSLLKSSYRAFTHLRKGWAKDTPYTAWACRNLLELRIITKYVIHSPVERRRFISTRSLTLKTSQRL